MDAASSKHPSEQILRNYGLGNLDAAKAEGVHRHLERCADCRKLTPLTERFGLCPDCGQSVRMTAGGELKVREMEIA